MKAATPPEGRTGSPEGFQSTPPVKAATADGLNRNTKRDISIHAAREGGDSAARPQSRAQAISIHAAREGGDCKILAGSANDHISIHAAREGGDGGNV